MSIPHVHVVYGSNGAENLSNACLNNIATIQQVSNLLLSLNVSIEQVQEQWAQWFSQWIGGNGSGASISSDPFASPTDTAQYSIAQLMAWADAQSNSTKGDYLQEVASVSATRNTNNNQMQSYFSQINNGVNQTSSNTEQVLQILQMMMQSLYQMMQSPFGG